MDFRTIQLMAQLRKVGPPISRGFPIVCVLFLSLTIQANLAQHRQKVRVPDEIARQWMNDEGVKSGNNTTARLPRDLHAETVDLNNDGKPEFIVAGICSPTGNCSTSIYRKVGSDYQELLNHDAQLVRVRPTVTHGYRDVVYDMHGSAFESWLFVYKFDGRKYQLRECFNSNYLGAHGRTKKRPTVTRRKCETDE